MRHYVLLRLGFGVILNANITHRKLPGCPFMDFIQPRARTFVDKNRCRVCHRADGYRRPEGAEASLGVIDVVLPEHPEPFESLRTLVTNKLRQRIQVACTNPSCKAVHSARGS